MYPARWGVETLFRELKSLLDVEPSTDTRFRSRAEIANLSFDALAAPRGLGRVEMDGRRVIDPTASYADDSMPCSLVPIA